MNWRDSAHPEGGGSERYVERVARGLVERGYDVTIRCPRYAGSLARETIDGVRYVRRGNKYTIYLHALLAVLFGQPNLVVDVQNGLPFLSRLVTRNPVVVLVHHLHRRQWLTSFGPVLGRLGWWIESRLAPTMYRRCRYVTVSQHTRAELVGLGVADARISVLPNGFDPPPQTDSPRSVEPLLVAVSRLVPHKRLEHAIEVLARLGERWPTLRLEIVGRGPWHDRLVRCAEEHGVSDRVVLHGWVEERQKHEILARSWVHLCPSAKEGWGIVVTEAAAHGVPSVAYRAAGGVCESIQDGRTGLLAEHFDDLVAGVELLLAEPHLRATMGAAGRVYARSSEWERTVDGFQEVIREAVWVPRQRRGESDRSLTRTAQR